MVRSVAHDVVLLKRVPDSVGVHAHLIFGVCWVRPQEIHGHLLNLFVDAAEVNFEWSADFLDVLDLHDSAAKACMDTEDSVVG